MRRLAQTEKQVKKWMLWEVQKDPNDWVDTGGDPLYTELAEAAANYFEVWHWLDDQDNPIWDWSVDVLDAYFHEQEEQHLIDEGMDPFEPELRTYAVRRMATDPALAYPIGTPVMVVKDYPALDYPDPQFLSTLTIPNGTTGVVTQAEPGLAVVTLHDVFDPLEEWDNALWFQDSDDTLGEYTSYIKPIRAARTALSKDPYDRALERFETAIARKGLIHAFKDLKNRIKSVKNEAKLEGIATLIDDLMDYLEDADKLLRSKL